MYGETNWITTCSACKEGDASPISNLCKRCYNKQWYQTNKESIKKEYVRKYNEEPEFRAKRLGYMKTYMAKGNNRATKKLKSGTPGNRFANGKSRAKERGLSWTLTKQTYFAMIQQPCFYCAGYFPPSKTGSGLDRLNNTLGYLPNNVVSCCGTCNKVRMDTFSPEETRVMVDAVITHRKLNNMNNEVFKEEPDETKD